MSAKLDALEVSVRGVERFHVYMLELHLEPADTATYALVSG